MGRRLIFFLIGIGFLLSSCASGGLQDRVSKLEAEVSSLKTQVRIAMAGGAGGSGQMRWRPGLSGGGDNLDGIACSGMAEGYVVIVPVISGTDARFYTYIYDASSEADESSPNVIKPDDSDANCSGVGRWLLGSMYAPSFIGNAADGYHYIDMSNSTTLVAGERADGRCWYAKDEDRIECYDGTNVQYWTATGNE